jgi:hypothetical protein
MPPDLRSRLDRVTQLLFSGGLNNPVTYIEQIAEAVLARSKARDLPLAEVAFSYGDHDGIISALEPFIGQSGWLTVSLFTVESLD